LLLTEATAEVEEGIRLIFPLTVIGTFVFGEFGRR
jgi:hypothetical protein